MTLAQWWARLLGRPMFPAKPLTHGGVIQRRPAPPAVPGPLQMTLIDTPHGSQRLGWVCYGSEPEAIAAITAPEHQGSRRVP